MTLDWIHTVTSIFAKGNHNTWYEGTVVSFDFSSLVYEICLEDGDESADSPNATMEHIANLFVKSGQQPVCARIQAGAPFAR